jgi:hypothetical protein
VHRCFPNYTAGLTGFKPSAPQRNPRSALGDSARVAASEAVARAVAPHGRGPPPALTATTEQPPHWRGPVTARAGYLSRGAEHDGLSKLRRPRATVRGRLRPICPSHRKPQPRRADRKSGTTAQASSRTGPLAETGGHPRQANDDPSQGQARTRPDTNACAAR